MCQAHRPFVEPREQEQIVHDRLQPDALLGHRGRELAHVGRRRMRGRDLRVLTDRCDRRPQLVRRVGDEPTLPIARRSHGREGHAGDPPGDERRDEEHRGHTDPERVRDGGARVGDVVQAAVDDDGSLLPTRRGDLTCHREEDALHARRPGRFARGQHLHGFLVRVACHGQRPAVGDPRHHLLCTRRRGIVHLSRQRSAHERDQCERRDDQRDPDDRRRGDGRADPQAARGRQPPSAASR